MAFLAAENENWQLEYLSQADFGRVLERFFLLVRTKSITKNFLNWKWGLLFVYVVFQRIFFFYLEAYRPRTLRFLFGDCWSFYFHSLIKSTFLVSKGLFRLYDKQNDTWLIVDVKFFFSCSTRHLRLVRCAHSWAINLNTRREIPYLRVLIYYSISNI